jgi:hypothetical protein
MTLIIRVDCLSHPDVVKVLGHDLSSYTSTRDGQGTLHVFSPVQIKWDASRPGTLLISFGAVGLRHTDDKHYVWVSSIARECNISVKAALAVLQPP